MQRQQLPVSGATSWSTNPIGHGSWLWATRLHTRISAATLKPLPTDRCHAGCCCCCCYWWWWRQWCATDTAPAITPQYSSLYTVSYTVRLFRYYTDHVISVFRLLAAINCIYYFTSKFWNQWLELVTLSFSALMVNRVTDCSRNWQTV